MENCPIEILEDILFRLPFAAALQATKVCKTWKTLVTDRFRNEVGFLVSYHLFKLSDLYDVQVHQYYGEQYDHIHGDDQDHRNKMMNYYYGSGRFNRNKWDDVVVGSCNGLVCYRKHGQQYAIRNPLTGEYVFLPQIDYASLTDWRDEESWSQTESERDGFGYCQSTNEYKVVRIYMGNILVYTIGSHEWRNVGIMHHKLYASGGIHANGVLHWLSVEVDKREHKIFGFDLKDEKFQLQLMPSCDPYNHFLKKHLKLLGGNLCYVQTTGVCFPSANRSCPCIEVWAYKRNDNNVKEHDHKYENNNNLWNWVKEFIIDIGYEYGFEPFAVTRSNQVLLWNKRYDLCIYDPKSSTLNKLWDVENDIRHSRTESIHTNSFLSRIECIPHTNSFVSLKDLGESGATMCNSSRKQDDKNSEEEILYMGSTLYLLDTYTSDVGMLLMAENHTKAATVLGN